MLLIYPGDLKSEYSNKGGNILSYMKLKCKFCYGTGKCLTAPSSDTNPPVCYQCRGRGYIMIFLEEIPAASGSGA